MQKVKKGRPLAYPPSRAPDEWMWPTYTRGADPQDWLPGRSGYCWYGLYERVAICLESGISFKEAFRTACDQQMVEIEKSVPKGPR